MNLKPPQRMFRKSRRPTTASQVVNGTNTTSFTLEAAPTARKPRPWRFRDDGPRPNLSKVVYDPNAIEYIVIHEAGHAVLAIVLGLTLHSVDIHRRTLPDGSLSLGATHCPFDLDYFNGKGEDAAVPFIIQTLAGAYAELRVNARVFEAGGHKGDLENAFSIATVAVASGTDLADGVLGLSQETVWRNMEPTNTLFSRANSEASLLVARHWGAIVAVASALLERKQLTGDEVASLVASASIVRDPLDESL